MAARGLVERGNPHEPMHAGFRRHQAERIFAREHEGDALEPRFLTGLVVDDFAPQAAALGPLDVHAKQHLRPVLGLGAARAGMNGHDRVGQVVLAAEHLARFRSVDFLLELVERAREIAGDLFARPGPFDQHADVVAAPLERLEKGAIFFEPPPALHHLLRPVLVAPEVGGRGARLYFGELLVESGAFKDASAARASVCSGLRSGV